MPFKITRKRTTKSTKRPAGVAIGARGRAPEADRRIGDLIDIGHTKLVVVHDAWSGDRGPTLGAYVLNRDDKGGFRGQVQLSKSPGADSTDVRRGRKHDDTKSETVALKAGDATTFLRYIAQAPAVPGMYTPHIDHTDDFPRIEIAIHVSHAGQRDGVALFFTASQGEIPSPWGAVLHGEVLTLPGDELGRALQVVRSLVAHEKPDNNVHRAHAKAGDWKTLPLPKARLRLPFRRSFSPDEWARIRAGLIPVEMEHKWFIYADDEWLWFHRSWTGYCIYKVRIRDTDRGGEIMEAWVNNNSKQCELDKFFKPKYLSHLIDLLLLGRS